MIDVRTPEEFELGHIEDSINIEWQNIELIEKTSQKDEKIYLLEANPRASRTLPYVSKSTGYPLARIAVNAMLGEKLKNLPEIIPMKGSSVKVPTFSWLKITQW